MSDVTETLPSAMAETEPSPPPSATTKNVNNISFSIWPPTERTREAVKNRLIETLSSPSILSKRYGTVSREEAVEAATKIEAEAFDSAGKSASTDDDGIEILQVYSKEISKKMLEAVKARSAESAAPQVTEEVQDADSNAPSQSENTESVGDNE